MADRYWVWWTWNWDASTTTHWSASSWGAGGASVPTSSDNVIFDSLSNATAYTVTITAVSNCLDFTMGWPLVWQVTWAGSSWLSIYWNLDLNWWIAWINRTYVAAVTFAATSWTKTIKTYWILLHQIIINWVWWTFQLLDAFRTWSSSNWWTLTNWTFDANWQDYILSWLWWTTTITGAWTFYNLSITPTTPRKDDIVNLTANIVVNWTLTTNLWATATNRVLIKSNILWTARTITAATVSLANVDFQDIIWAGAWNWNLSAITWLSGDCGGNTWITFTTPADQHWLNASSSTWSTASNWTSRVPLPQDNVFMDKAFWTSQTVTADMPRLWKTIDWIGATWTTALTWNISTSSIIYGSLTMINSLTLSWAGSWITFSWRGNYTITSNGLTFENPFTIDAITWTYTLWWNLTLWVTRSMTVTNGTLSTSTSNYVLSIWTLSVATAATLALWTETDLLTGTWTVLSISWTITWTNYTLKITDTSNTQITIFDNWKTFNNIWFARWASTATITLNAFGSQTTVINDLKDTWTVAHSILFDAGSKRTVTTFTVSWTAWNLITLNSTTTWTYTLTAPSRNNASPVSCDYLNIQHCIATQANTWYAWVNSVNNQAVATAGSWWIFTAPVTSVNTNMWFFNLCY